MIHYVIPAQTGIQASPYATPLDVRWREHDKISRSV